MKDATLAIHAGFQCDPVTKSVAVPIYQNVAYEFDSAQHAADLFNLEVPGNIYSRIMNPTNDVLEKRMAALEGGIAALVLSSGSAATREACVGPRTAHRRSQLAAGRVALRWPRSRSSRHACQRVL